MIESTNAYQTFQINIGRTDALIEAIDKIYAYNRIYQGSEAANSLGLEHARAVAKIQNEQFEWIKNSCAEHAIISMATAFETYYKELLQELLANFPEFFLSNKTTKTDNLHKLISSNERYDWEDIRSRLELMYRHSYINFFKNHSVPFLSEEEEKFVEYIFKKRNGFVHNASKLDKRTEEFLNNNPSPVNEENISTEAKRLRTKLKKIVDSINKRVTESFD